MATLKSHLQITERSGHNPAWDALCDADMVLYPGFMPPIQGLVAIKEFTAALHSAFSNFSLAVDDLVLEGDRAAVRMTTGGTHTAPLASPAGIIPPTGKRMAMQGISFLRFADGKIVEERAQMDVLGAMQQLGVIPAPGSPEG